MEIITLTGGIIDTNTYIVADEGECAIIDCGVKARVILNTLLEKELKAKYIILTHGHFDHAYFVPELKEVTGAPVCLHEDETELYLDPHKNGFVFFGVRNIPSMPKPDLMLRDGQKLRLGDMDLEILHTPGHSPGGICIKAQHHLFTGDTLFAMSVGRTDFYGGSGKALHEAITGKLFLLPDETLVYPGHGPKSSIGYEKEHNPYV